MIGAADHRPAGLDGLPEGIQNRARELRQLVEKQDPTMCQRHLAGSGLGAAADQRWHAAGVMRVTKWSTPGNPAFGKHAGDGLNHADSSASEASSGGRMPGILAASIDLPAPGGPIISKL